MHHQHMQPVAVASFPRPRLRAPGLAMAALALALLTGLALGQLQLLGGALIQPSPGGSSQAPSAGVEFYAAIDAYLATGETGRLRALTHPDFIDHTAGVPATPGIEAVLHQLDALQALDPGARLTVQPLSSSRDMARFAVSIAPSADARVLGLPLAQTETAVTSETLRIVDGRVAERWSDLQRPVASTSLASITWDPPAASQMLPPSSGSPCCAAAR
jgi:hypothetical protein